MLSKLAMGMVKILREAEGNGGCTSKSQAPIVCLINMLRTNTEDQGNKRTHEQVQRYTDTGSWINALSVGLNKSQNIRNEIIMQSHVICFRVK
jgi:hypothetical protein